MKDANAMLSEFLSGNMTEPIVTMRGLLLLEKAGSPFVTQGELVVNYDGTLMKGADGKPMRESVTPSLGDVATAFYILINQTRPDILQIIRNPDTLEMCVLQFAGGLSPEDLSRVSAAVSSQMAAMNAFNSKMPGGAEEKKVQTGGTVLPQASSSSAEAVSTTYASGLMPLPLS